MSLRPVYLLRLLLLFLCSFFLLPMAFSAKAFAAADPITVTSQSDVVHFPGSIDFAMSARDTAGSIMQATIYITYKEAAYSIAQEHSVTLNRPARFVTVNWHEDTGGNNFHTPGTPIEYNWVLHDSANNYHTESPKDFTTIDTRYSWQHLSQDLLQVNWYNRSTDFGRLLLKQASDSINRISLVLGGGLLHPINLWVYASNQDFHGALAPGSYEWVGGEAHPALSEAFISVIDESDDTLLRDMPHELTHLVFHQLIAQGQQAPTWFDEGLAVYNQLFHEPEMRYRFEQAVNKKSLLRLNNISDGFPSDGDQAYLAYAQSWDLITYMYTTFGRDKMKLLIKKMNDPNAEFNEDLAQILGQDQDHLENQWLLHLGQPGILRPDQLTPTPQAVAQTHQLQPITTDSTAPVFITAGSLLIFLPIIGIVVMLIYQRRRRQQELVVAATQQRQQYPSFGQGSMQAHNTYYAGSAQYRPSMPGNVSPMPRQQVYPAQQVQQVQLVQPQQPDRSWQQPAPFSYPQTYMPFPSFAPEQAYGTPPVSSPAQPPQSTPMPSRSFNRWQPDPPAMSEEVGTEDENTGSMQVPFGPFKENVNQQPQKKAPQE
jgi:Peptidase MA superfamily